MDIHRTIKGKPPCVLTDSGFTLLELVVSLVIVGILASVASMGVVAAMNSYVVVRENVSLSQKMELAATRIQRELMELTDIVTINETDPYLIYDSIEGERRAIARSGSTIRLHILPNGATSLGDSVGNTLTDRVNSFSLLYNPIGNTSDWSVTDDIRDLFSIQFILRLDREDISGATLDVDTTVHLRNNDNLGGRAATGPIAPPTANQYNCFISTSGATMENGSGKRMVWGCLLGGLVLLSALIRKSFGHGKRVLKTTRYNRESGNTLIGLVVVILVFAALGAAIIPLISSSQLQHTDSLRSTQAFYLAESGLRYAASQYLNAPNEAAQFTAMSDLHDAGLHFMPDSQHQFKLSIKPYYTLVESPTSASSNLVTRYYGESGFPSVLGSGRLSVDGNPVTYDSAAKDTVNRRITFALGDPITVAADIPVYPVAQTRGEEQTLADGGNLNLEANSGEDLFPVHNGSFELNGTTYTYRQRDLDSGTLISIRRTDGTRNFTPISLGSSPVDIRLKKFVRVTATGQVGSGGTMASRETVYHVQIPEERRPMRLEFHDRFDQPNPSWNSDLGGHAIQNIAGNKVLRVTESATTSNLSPRTSLIRFGTAGAQFNPDQFDAQVKIGYLDTPVPIHNWDPRAPFPAYYSAGLLFRLYSGINTYGLSYQRGNRTLSPIPDNINNYLVPVDNKHTVVLWQYNDVSTTPHAWLAYKELPIVNTLMEEGAESGATGWNSTGDLAFQIAPFRASSGFRSFYYGRPAYRDYNTGDRNSGVLISPPVTLGCDYHNYRLQFDSWHQTEADQTKDLKFVDILDADENLLKSNIFQVTGTMNSWVTYGETVPISLADFAGRTIRIRFRFDSVDSASNAFEGWYIDNVRILADYPLERSTLLARFKQAASLTFNSGGKDEIAPKDRIVGLASNASATVYGGPVLSIGSWADESASGALLLDNVTGTFQVGEKLEVPGKSADMATVVGVYAKSNFIQAYLGTEQGCGTPNSNALDSEKRANPIDPVDGLNWPPDAGDAWTAETDAFQLIQWDAVNPAISTVEAVPSVDAPNTLLRSWESVLLGPGSTLGLHTFGKGSDNIYFDDFGYQSFVDQPVAVSQPLQY